MNALAEALPLIKIGQHQFRSIRWKSLDAAVPPDQTPVLVRSPSGWGVAMFFNEDDWVSQIWPSAKSLGDFTHFAEP